MIQHSKLREGRAIIDHANSTSFQAFMRTDLTKLIALS